MFGEQPGSSLLLENQNSLGELLGRASPGSLGVKLDES